MDYQVQPDGTIIQPIALSDIQDQLAAAEGNLQVAISDKAAVDANYDAKIVTFQATVDSLTQVIAAAQAAQASS